MLHRSMACVVSRTSVGAASRRRLEVRRLTVQRLAVGLFSLGVACIGLCIHGAAAVRVDAPETKIPTALDAFMGLVKGNYFANHGRVPMDILRGLDDAGIRRLVNEDFAAENIKDPGVPGMTQSDLLTLALTRAFVERQALLCDLVKMLKPMTEALYVMIKDKLMWDEGCLIYTIELLKDSPMEANMLAIDPGDGSGNHLLSDNVVVQWVSRGKFTEEIIEKVDKARPDLKADLRCTLLHALSKEKVLQRALLGIYPADVLTCLKTHLDDQWGTLQMFLPPEFGLNRLTGSSEQYMAVIKTLETKPEYVKRIAEHLNAEDLCSLITNKDPVETPLRESGKPYFDERSSDIWDGLSMRTVNSKWSSCILKLAEESYPDLDPTKWCQKGMLMVAHYADFLRSCKVSSERITEAVTRKATKCSLEPGTLAEVYTTCANNEMFSPKARDVMRIVFFSKVNLRDQELARIVKIDGLFSNHGEYEGKYALDLCLQGKLNPMDVKDTKLFTVEQAKLLVNLGIIQVHDGLDTLSTTLNYAESDDSRVNESLRNRTDRGANILYNLCSQPFEFPPSRSACPSKRLETLIKKDGDWLDDWQVTRLIYLLDLNIGDRKHEKKVCNWVRNAEQTKNWKKWCQCSKGEPKAKKTDSTALTEEERGFYKTSSAQWKAAWVTDWYKSRRNTPDTLEGYKKAKKQMDNTFHIVCET